MDGVSPGREFTRPRIASAAVALASVRGELSRYRLTAVLLAAAVAAGIGFAGPLIGLGGRLALEPLRGGDLGLTWRAGVMPVAAVQQRALDELSGLLVASAIATLAIAAITVLVLALAREAERTAEVVVRRAVGAGRGILLASALLEGGLVAVSGTAVGAVVALIWSATASEWPGILREGLSLASLLGAAALILVVLMGVTYPVLLPRRRVGEAEPHSPAPLMPSAIQIGASLIALTMAALLGRHAAAIMAGTSGTANGAVYSVGLRDTAPAERAERYDRFLQLLADSGVSITSLTSPGVLLGLGPVGTVTTDCGQCSEAGMPIRFKVKPATHRFVSADSFQMLGIKLVEGRGIAAADRWSTPRVAVINRSLAAREFQDGRAIGRGIRVVNDGDQWSTVVGVVEDPPTPGLGAAIQPRYSVYLSVLQYPPSSLDLFLRDDPRKRQSLPRIARTALGADGLSPAPASLGQMVRSQAVPLRWLAGRFALEGWAMLALAALATMAVTRLWVASLLGELGLRRALGAGRARIMVYVLLRAVGVGCAGIAGGAWFGAAVWAGLAELVPGVAPWDTGLVARYASILLLSVIFGALPPVWRASRETPASLLSSA